jgi:hypothetical protein
MAALLVELQREWSGRTDELLELGLPDCRPAALARGGDPPKAFSSGTPGRYFDSMLTKVLVTSATWSISPSSWSWSASALHRSSLM